MGDVTRLLDAAGAGDRAALERLYVQVYDELRRLAESRLRQERAGHTLQPTALVNEAYLRLSPAASAGRTAAISSAPPRRRCAASWSTTHARNSRTSATAERA